MKDDKKGWKKSFKKYKGHKKSNSTSKSNSGPKPEKNVYKIPLKNTQYYDVKGSVTMHLNASIEHSETKVRF